MSDASQHLTRSGSTATRLILQEALERELVPPYGWKNPSSYQELVFWVRPLG